MRRIILCIVIGMLASACGDKAGTLHHTARYAERDTLSVGLINDKDAKLSNEAIGQLLSSKIVIPKRVKLAIANLGHQSFDDWRRSYRPNYYVSHVEREDLEFLRAQLAATKTVMRDSKLLGEVTLVPPLLLPESPGLTQLRESAALMQAELLLVHRSRSQVVTDINIFSPSEFTSRVELETALIDVRTGAIPFAETYDVSKTVTNRDRTWNQARKLAEQQALEEAAASLGKDLTEFLAPLSAN